MAKTITYCDFEQHLLVFVLINTTQNRNEITFAPTRLCTHVSLHIVIIFFTYNTTQNTEQTGTEEAVGVFNGQRKKLPTIYHRSNTTLNQ